MALTQLNSTQVESRPIPACLDAKTNITLQCLQNPRRPPTYWFRKLRNHYGHLLCFDWEKHDFAATYLFLTFLVKCGHLFFPTTYNLTRLLELVDASDIETGVV